MKCFPQNQVTIPTLSRTALEIASTDRKTSSLLQRTKYSSTPRLLSIGKDWCPFVDFIERQLRRGMCRPTHCRRRASACLQCRLWQIRLRMSHLLRVTDHCANSSSINSSIHRSIRWQQHTVTATMSTSYWILPIGDCCPRSFALGERFISLLPPNPVHNSTTRLRHGRTADSFSLQAARFACSCVHCTTCRMCHCVHHPETEPALPSTMAGWCPTTKPVLACVVIRQCFMPPAHHLRGYGEGVGYPKSKNHWSDNLQGEDSRRRSSLTYEKLRAIELDHDLLRLNNVPTWSPPSATGRSRRSSSCRRQPDRNPRCPKRHNGLKMTFARFTVFSVWMQNAFFEPTFLNYCLNCSPTLSTTKKTGI